MGASNDGTAAFDRRFKKHYVLPLLALLFGKRLRTSLANLSGMFGAHSHRLTHIDSTKKTASWLLDPCLSPSSGLKSEM